MYRHIMYRGKNTSVPTVETCRGTSYTMRVGVCRVKHYVSGHVVSNITCRGLLRQTLSYRTRRVTHCRVKICENNNQRSTLQHYNNITKRQQSTTKSPPPHSSLLEAHCSLFSVFFPASNPQAAIISSPREARIVVIMPCEVR